MPLSPSFSAVNHSTDDNICTFIASCILFNFVQVCVYNNLLSAGPHLKLDMTKEKVQLTAKQISIQSSYLVFYNNPNKH